jgi:hypothetical protein
MSPEHTMTGIDRTLRTVVFAPPYMAGGVKSLYSVCDWFNEFGPSRIIPFHEPTLATWFSHNCELYDYSYPPDIVIYPEVYQPNVAGKYNVCFALGQHAPIQPHASITICRSVQISDWVAAQLPNAAKALILPSIKRAIFEYDDRPKKSIICYMTRPNKHPETAELLRKRYGDLVVEIVDQTEAQVAETLRNAKVFVWRGSDKEGSPRPPKEALVAGCVVVGLESELTERQHINFGVHCSNESQLIQMAGQALDMPTPSIDQRSMVRDSQAEKNDWIALFKSLGT